MKSYKEMADEALRRRDAYLINRKKNIKKATAALSVVGLFILICGTSWYIASNITGKPNTPPTQTTAENTTSDTNYGFTDSGVVTDPFTETCETTTVPKESTLTDTETDVPAETPTESDHPMWSTNEYVPPESEVQSDIILPVYSETEPTAPSEVVTDHMTEPQETPPLVNIEPEPSETTVTDPVEPPEDTSANDAPQGTSPSPTETDTDTTTDTEPDEVLLPPMPGRVAKPGEVDPEMFYGKEPESIYVPDDPVVMEPSSPEDPIPGADPWEDDVILPVLYYSIDFDVEDYYFLDKNTSIPETVPVYMLDSAATPDSLTQLNNFLVCLYGENFEEAGSFSDGYVDPIFFSEDAWIEAGSIGRFISTDSEDNTIYFYMNMFDNSTGGSYRDMTEHEALEFFKSTPHYAAISEFLGIKNEMVNTEIYRYYADNSYEYRFNITEYADNVFDAEYNYATGSVEIRMTFVPGFSRLKVAVTVKCPTVLKVAGTADTLSYNDAAALLLDKYISDKYYNAYSNSLMMTVKYTYEEIENGVKIISPYYCYYMGYADIDGSTSYRLDKLE